MHVGRNDEIYEESDDEHQHSNVVYQAVSTSANQSRRRTVSPVREEGYGAADHQQHVDEHYHHKTPIHIYSHDSSKRLHWLHVTTPGVMIVTLLVITIVFTIVFRSTSVYVEYTLKVPHAAVATDSPLCSKIGSNVLRAGGANAVDAAIASLLCLGVTRPYASGIGGGGFMTIHMAKTKTNDFINFREMAPAASTADMFDNDYQKSVAGGLSVAVPGEIAGLWEAHQTYGKAPWASLFTEAIKLARDGFKLDKLFQMRLEQNRDAIMKSPSLRNLLTKVNEDGQTVLLAAGDVLKRPGLAHTLEKIALSGPSGFYEGAVAEAIVNQIQHDGGILTLDDMKNFKVERMLRDQSPLLTMANLTSRYQDYYVVTGPPPSSGVLINFMLNVLDDLLVDMPLDPFNYAQKYHFIIEALKFGFTHRMSLGDQMSPENITRVLGEHILSTDYAKHIAKYKIEPQTTFPWSHYYWDEHAEIKGQGTTHVSVIDEERNGVSVTSTVNHSFGSKLYNAETGVLLNNQMNDFTVDNRKNEFGLLPSRANIIAPGKRPQSSMSPTILLDKNGNMKMAIGASGGPTILSAIVQVIISILDFRLDTYNAINMPRVHSQPPTDVVEMEEGIVRVILDTLIMKGHEFKITKVLADGHSIGNVQVVQVGSNGQLLAASDNRKFGKPAGF